MSSPTPPRFPAQLFDGKNATAHPVLVSFVGDSLVILDDFWKHSTKFHLDNIQITPSLLGTPCMIRLPSGGQLHIPDTPELKNVLQQFLPRHEKFLAKLERNWGLVATSLLGAVIVSVGFYFYGLDLAVSTVKPLLTFEQKQFIGRQFIWTLDRSFFSPTQFDDKKVASIRQLLADLHPERVLNHPVHLELRKFQDQPNAFAVLPDTIFVTDKLVEMLPPEQIRAIISHEVGHLHYDHGTRGLLRGTILGIVTVLAFGGDPGTAITLSTSALEARHSQDQETAADEFGVKLMLDAGFDPEAAALALESITKNEKEDEISAFLNSHPMTKNRTAAIRAFKQPAADPR